MDRDENKQAPLNTVQSKGDEAYTDKICSLDK